MTAREHTTTMRQQIISRPYRDFDDFWKVRKLLVETYPITGRGFNWDVRRWDGRHFYEAAPGWKPEWEKQGCLWETADDRLVGAVHSESDGFAYLELHPDYRGLEAEMIQWAEEYLAVPAEDGRRQVTFFAYEYDAPRSRILARRGYEKQTWGGILRYMRFGSGPLPPVEIAAGYKLRAIRTDYRPDQQGIADLLNAAFNRDFHNAEEFAVFAQQAPSFDPDLHLVAEAPDGSIAAHVGVIYEPVNRAGLFEPVCTHPDHRRRRLAQTLMFEGLHRLKARGALDVTVETGDAEAANRLYDTIGFTEHYKGYYWRKVF